MLRMKKADARCRWTDHEWVTTHYANGTAKQKMICNACGHRTTIGKIEATNRLLTAKRIAGYREK